MPKISSPNENAAKWTALGIGIFVYIAAVVYSDVMFIQVVSKAFPNGVLAWAAIAGAFSIGLTGLAIPLALHYWLSPGIQFWAGMGCWLLDTVILVMNCILAFALATGPVVDPWLLKYKELCPAAPMAAIVIWGVLFLLDNTHKLRHAQARLHSAQVDAYTQALIAESNNEEVMEEARRQAQLAARETMIAITGKSLRHQKVLTPRTVEGTGHAIHSGDTSELPAVNVNKHQPLLDELAGYGVTDVASLHEALLKVGDNGGTTTARKNGSKRSA